MCASLIESFWIRTNLTHHPGIEPRTDRARTKPTVGWFILFFVYKKKKKNSWRRSEKSNARRKMILNVCYLVLAIRIYYYYTSTLYNIFLFLNKVIFWVKLQLFFFKWPKIQLKTKLTVVNQCLWNFNILSFDNSYNTVKNDRQFVWVVLDILLHY